MMNEDTFWTIIAQASASKESSDMNALGDRLMELLQEGSVDAIAGFHTRMLLLKESLKFPMMRDIAFMMGYGDNDTAYGYFLSWVIALGKEHYQKALNSPAHLLTLEDPELFVAGRSGFEDLDLVAQAAFFEKTDLDFADWHIALKKDKRLEQIKVNEDNEQGLER
jgi:hypothetical protein